MSVFLQNNDSASSLANEQKIKIFTQNEIEQTISRYKYWVSNDISETIVYQFVNGFLLYLIIVF